ncbi:MAG: EAL domain-containing protein [Candidatus Omnitrophica bacterium]|nr:EAL domain-containing protein [Candidatus Omnitrophota bacterium]
MLNSVIRRQILVVDSEVSFVRNVLSILEGYGFDVLTATSAQGALQKAASLDIDLILLGEELPDSSGIEICKRLKSSDKSEHIPIIILIHGKSEYRIKGYHAGADDCINKDSELDELLARMEAVWRRGNGEFRKMSEDRQKKVAQELSRIIEEELIEPHFQAIYFLKPFRLFGLEVLSRPKGGTFISNADELFRSAIKYEMYYPLEMLCWKKALEVVSSRTKNEHIFFNCSPYLVENEKFPLIKTVFESNRIPFNKVILEITERSAISEYDLFFSRLNQFRDCGFSFAIDDVGGGYATLESIVATKPEIVKIDRHIIHGVHNDTVKRSIVKFIVAFCKDNQIISIAEGVEDKDDLQAVMDLGIDAVQGYYLFRPTPSLNIREMKDICVAFS